MKTFGQKKGRKNLNRLLDSPKNKDDDPPADFGALLVEKLFLQNSPEEIKKLGPREELLGMTPLAMAAAIGKTEAVQKLLEVNADVNEYSIDGNTPLMLAIQSKNVEIVDMLLKHNADVNLVNAEGNNALMIALITGDSKVINAVWPYRQKLNINHQNLKGYTALHLVADKRWDTCVHFLLVNGANVNATAENGWTPLFLAIGKNDLKSVEQLVSNGADVLLEDQDQMTAICHAVELEVLDIADYLINSLIPKDKLAYVQRQVDKLHSSLDDEACVEDYTEVLLPTLRLIARRECLRDEAYDTQLIPSLIHHMARYFNNHEISSCVGLIIINLCYSWGVAVDEKFVVQYMEADGPRYTQKVLKHFCEYLNGKEAVQTFASCFFPCLTLSETAHGRAWLKAHCNSLIYYAELMKQHKAMDSVEVIYDGAKVSTTNMWKRFLDFFDQLQTELRERNLAELLESEEREKRRQELKASKRRQRKRQRGRTKAREAEAAAQVPDRCPHHCVDHCSDQCPEQPSKLFPGGPDPPGHCPGLQCGQTVATMGGLSSRIHGDPAGDQCSDQSSDQFVVDSWEEREDLLLPEPCDMVTPRSEPLSEGDTHTSLSTPRSPPRGFYEEIPKPPPTPYRHPPTRRSPKVSPRVTALETSDDGQEWTTVSNRRQGRKSRRRDGGPDKHHRQTRKSGKTLKKSPSGSGLYKGYRSGSGESQEKRKEGESAEWWGEGDVTPMAVPLKHPKPFDYDEDFPLLGDGTDRSSAEVSPCSSRTDLQVELPPQQPSSTSTTASQTPDDVSTASLEELRPTPRGEAPQGDTPPPGFQAPPTSPGVSLGGLGLGMGVTPGMTSAFCQPQQLWCPAPLYAPVLPLINLASSGAHQCFLYGLSAQMGPGQTLTPIPTLGLDMGQFSGQGILASAPPASTATYPDSGSTAPGSFYSSVSGAVTSVSTTVPSLPSSTPDLATPSSHPAPIAYADKVKVNLSGLSEEGGSGSRPGSAVSGDSSRLTTLGRLPCTVGESRGEGQSIDARMQLPKDPADLTMGRASEVTSQALGAGLSCWAGRGVAYGEWLQPQVGGDWSKPLPLPSKAGPGCGLLGWNLPLPPPAPGPETVPPGYLAPEGKDLLLTALARSSPPPPASPTPPLCGPKTTQDSKPLVLLHSSRIQHKQRSTEAEQSAMSVGDKTEDRLSPIGQNAPEDEDEGGLVCANSVGQDKLQGRGPGKAGDGPDLFRLEALRSPPLRPLGEGEGSAEVRGHNHFAKVTPNWCPRTATGSDWSALHGSGPGSCLGSGDKDVYCKGMPTLTPGHGMSLMGEGLLPHRSLFPGFQHNGSQSAVPGIHLIERIAATQVRKNMEIMARQHGNGRSSVFDHDLDFLASLHGLSAHALHSTHTVNFAQSVQAMQPMQSLPSLPGSQHARSVHPMLPMRGVQSVQNGVLESGVQPPPSSSLPPSRSTHPDSQEQQQSPSVEWGGSKAPCLGVIGAGRRKAKKEWSSHSRRWKDKLRLIHDYAPQFRRILGPMILPAQSADFNINPSGNRVIIGYLVDGTEVAIKVMEADTSQLNRQLISRLVASSTSVQFLLKYLAFAEHCGKQFLAMELCDYTLEEYIQIVQLDHNQDPLSTNKLVWQLLKGLKHLHSDLGLVHGNLKPDNIFVDCEGKLRLGGYGMRPWCSRQDRSSKGGYNRCWMATEQLIAEAEGRTPIPTVSADIQVAGMLVYYILTGGRHPFGETPYEIETNLRHLQGAITFISEEANDLVSDMLFSDPAARPSIDDCLMHPYFWSDEKRFRLILICGSDVLKEMKTGVALTGSGGTPMLDFLNNFADTSPTPNSCDNWMSEIEPVVMREMRQFRQYKNTRSEFVLFIYNCCLHFDKMSSTLRETLGDPCSYFISKFPSLFMSVYRAIKVSDRTERTCYKPFF